MSRGWLSPVIAIVLVAAGNAAGAAGGIEAVTTPRTGTLTMCLDWFVYSSCNTYHHVALPGRIAVGDRVELTYGSNPKDYTFHVRHIRRHNGGCTILSDRSSADGKGERIEIAPCRTAVKPAAAH